MYARLQSVSPSYNVCLRLLVTPFARACARLPACVRVHACIASVLVCVHGSERSLCPTLSVCKGSFVGLLLRMGAHVFVRLSEKEREREQTDVQVCFCPAHAREEKNDKMKLANTVGGGESRWGWRLRVDYMK